MYTKPDMHKPVDRLAHFLSDCHNDRAPIGWESYRFLAEILLSKFAIEDIVLDSRFFDHQYQPGKQRRS